MNNRLEALLSVVITCCAVAVTATSVQQRVANGKAPGIRPPEKLAITEWQNLKSNGSLIGSMDATVLFVEFGDYQCPFCRLFHEAVGVLSREFPGHVSLVYYHYPLASHSHAEAAARGAVCAERQGQFAEYTSSLFSEQDSIGRKSWNSFALSAEVPDTAQFSECLQSDSTISRVDADRALGRRLSVTATPTVVLNGWRFSMTPRVDSLRYLVSEIVNGRSPFGDGR